MKAGGEVQTNAWDEVALSCQVEWPLQLLITKEALAVYNEMFRYLVRIRRVAVELESAWKAAMEADRRERIGGRQTRAQRAQRFPLWALRHAMTHLVGNLQLYIQVDVVEVQWAALQERVGASRDFTQVAEYHEG